MTLSMLRIVLFTKDMPGWWPSTATFGLTAQGRKGWKEFDANGCVIALHNGTSPARPPKIGFWARTSPPPAD